VAAWVVPSALSAEPIQTQTDELLVSERDSAQK